LRVAILGLGNLLLGDEGFGVHALRYLEGEIPPDVALIDGGTRGLYLYPFLEGVTHLIILDVVRLRRPPGTVITLGREELNGAIVPKISAHDVALPDLLALLEMGGGGPRDIRLVGVVPGEFGARVGLSEEVRAALPKVKEEVLSILRQWGVM